MKLRDEASGGDVRTFINGATNKQGTFAARLVSVGASADHLSIATNTDVNTSPMIITEQCKSLSAGYTSLLTVRHLLDK